MATQILVAQALLVLLGPGLLAIVLRRRRPGIRFGLAYAYLAPGFLASAALKIIQYRTGLGFLEYVAPLVMVIGVLAGVRKLERRQPR